MSRRIHPIMTDNYGRPPVLGPEHERLGVFIGQWHAEGKSYSGKDQDPNRPKANAASWISDETTKWHPGKFFLIQEERAEAGGEPLIAHAIIGFDPSKVEYFAHAVENHGFYRKYDVEVEGPRMDLRQRYRARPHRIRPRRQHANRDLGMAAQGRSVVAAMQSHQQARVNAR